MGNIINLVAPPGWGKTYGLNQFMYKSKPWLNTQTLWAQSTPRTNIEFDIDIDLLIIEECNQRDMHFFMQKIHDMENIASKYGCVIIVSQEPITDYKFSQVKYKPIEIRFDVQGMDCVIDFRSQIEFNKGVVWK